MESFPQTLGRYELTRPLAEGGFGEVLVGRVLGPADFFKTVAIKRIREEFSDSDDLVNDFMKEARIGSFLNHHNVVQVLDFERLGGRHALVMEYVDGTGLDAVLAMARDGELEIPLDCVLEIITQAAEGLRYIHNVRDSRGCSLQLVHRDLKPSNLLLSRNGMVKISDFGVARTRLGLGGRTAAGTVKGTLGYMSPEQARGETVDQRSDLYNLGAILYDLLMLEPLHQDPSGFALLRKLAENEVDEQLARIRCGRAAVFFPLLRRLLTRTPEERIPSANRVLIELRKIRSKLAPAEMPWPVRASQWAEAVEHLEPISEATPRAERTVLDCEDSMNCRENAETPDMRTQETSPTALSPRWARQADAQVTQPIAFHQIPDDLPFTLPEGAEFGLQDVEQTLETKLNSNWVRGSLRAAPIAPERPVISSSAPLSRTQHSSRSGKSSLRCQGAPTQRPFEFTIASRRTATSRLTVRTAVLCTVIAITLLLAGESFLNHVLRGSGNEAIAMEPTSSDSRALLPGMGYSSLGGAVVVTSTQPVDVVFDGVDLGSTPTKLIKLPAGEYTVEVYWPRSEMQQAFRVPVTGNGTMGVTCTGAGCKMNQL